VTAARPAAGPQRLRLFVACELSDEVRRALAAAQDGLRRTTSLRLRWVRPEGIHITLKFLGEVEAVRVEEIERTLAKAIEPLEARVRPARLGGFGGSRLRVVWVGLEGDVDRLVGLAARVDEALAALGFPRERRPFAAHLTLARVPDEVSLEERGELARLLEGYSIPELPSMRLTEVHLIQSILGPGGSVYQRLATFPRPAT
jgi:2'-5' RNA ligase